MLAAILRPKMPVLLDVACAKVVLLMLGINMDKPRFGQEPILSIVTNEGETVQLLCITRSLTEFSASNSNFGPLRRWALPLCTFSISRIFFPRPNTSSSMFGGRFRNPQWSKSCYTRFARDSSIRACCRWWSVSFTPFAQESAVANELAAETLRLALTAHWSAQDSIKPVFSYLVSTLCQSGPYRCSHYHTKMRL